MFFITNLIGLIIALTLVAQANNLLPMLKLVIPTKKQSIFNKVNEVLQELLDVKKAY